MTTRKQRKTVRPWLIIRLTVPHNPLGVDNTSPDPNGGVGKPSSLVGRVNPVGTPPASTSAQASTCVHADAQPTGVHRKDTPIAERRRPFHALQDALYAHLTQSCSQLFVPEAWVV